MVTNAPLLQYYDPSKELTIQCDASQSGLGAALLQEGAPVAYASRAMTEVEQRYAQIEKEMLAMVFSLEKFNQYTYGRKVTVMTDHKPLESILKKPLMKAPKRLQAMMLRLQKYDIEAVYLQGKKMYLADTLSRAYIPETPSESETIEYVHATTFLPISEARLKNIQENTMMDETLKKLQSVIITGWPDDKSNLSIDLHPYYQFRHELSVQDGLVMRGDRVVIPANMRKLMKEKLHASHLGVNGCLRRARECLYWPGMTQEIKDHLACCDICRSMDTQQAKETLIHHNVPGTPWSKVGTDLFTVNSREYLMTVDYYSGFFEIDYLPDTTSVAVIKKLKVHFARYGIPEIVISDNGPQYMSEEFHRFSQSWDFEHYTSSPGHQQANGKAEASVKIAKRLMKKCEKAGSDVYAALLDYRNTPSPGHETSPAQRCLGRRTRAFLPMSHNLLKPSYGSENSKILKQRQQKQAEQYNKSAKDLPPLEEEDIVRIKPYSKHSEWIKGQVTRRLDERSYEITAGDRTLRRNRVDLRKSKEAPPTVLTDNTTPTPLVTPPTTSTTAQPIAPQQPKSPTKAVKTPEKAATSVAKPKDIAKPKDVATQDKPMTSRSGRPIKVPLKYRE
jgi:transposase InsO family protein